MVDDTYGFGEPRIYNDTCPTLRSERYGLKVIQCAAMRGRYNSDGKIEQQLELGSSDHANALTTVQKDCLIVEKRKEY